jgi:hypothetical protein
VLCLYKPLVSVLRQAALVHPGSAESRGSKIGLYLFAGGLLITCIVFLLVLRGVV